MSEGFALILLMSHLDLKLPKAKVDFEVQILGEVRTELGLIRHLSQDVFL